MDEQFAYLTFPPSLVMEKRGETEGEKKGIKKSLSVRPGIPLDSLGPSLCSPSLSLYLFLVYEIC